MSRPPLAFGRAGIALVAASALASLGAAPPPVVGGEPTSAYPEAVLVILEGYDGAVVGLCTGTVVGRDWVLTAAHCVAPADGYSPTEATVAFVDDLDDVTAGTLSGAEWTVHPDYDAAAGTADVALLALAEPSPVAPAALFTGTPSGADDGRRFTIVGFGLAAHDDYSGDVVKREAEVEQVDFDADWIYTEDGAGEANGCQGDSGGPLFRLGTGGAYAVAGVMNWVTTCEGGTMGSQRVDTVASWVLGYVDDASTVDDLGEGPVDAETDGMVVDGRPVEPNGVGCAAVPGASAGLLLAGLLAARGLQRPE